MKGEYEQKRKKEEGTQATTESICQWCKLMLLFRSVGGSCGRSTGLGVQLDETVRNIPAAACVLPPLRFPLWLCPEL